MSASRINASISLLVSAACERMTQPRMIDAFSSNGLAHCPSYRLRAARPGLKKKKKKKRGLLGDYTDTHKKTQSHDSRNNKYSSWEKDQLVNDVFESRACISLKCFTLLIEGIRSQQEDLCNVERLRTIMRHYPGFENDQLLSRVHFNPWKWLISKYNWKKVCTPGVQIKVRFFLFISFVVFFIGLLCLIFHYNDF